MRKPESVASKQQRYRQPDIYREKILTEKLLSLTLVSLAESPMQLYPIQFEYASIYGSSHEKTWECCIQTAKVQTAWHLQEKILTEKLLSLTLISLAESPMQLNSIQYEYASIYGSSHEKTWECCIQTAKVQTAWHLQGKNIDRKAVVLNPRQYGRISNAA